MNHRMLPVIIITVVLLILPFILEKSAHGEFVFLKDGSIIEGAIISDNANSITLRGPDKKLQHIKRGDIMRILYTKLKMAKVFIQKRDGKALVAFIVDEDQESYTLRNELYSAEEFILKRSDVLFMAEKNPSGLQPEGDVGTDRVALTWLAPYGEVKKYNIYLKKGEKLKYELVESIKGKSVTLKNLISNTTYFIIVTSIDSDDYESTPSNELKIKTANLPPDKPKIISAEKNPTDGTVNYSWKHSSDPDGKVVKYRVYGTRDGKKELILELKGNDYTLKNPENFSKMELAAVDDLGAESETAGLTLFKNRYIFSVYPGMILPQGKFGNMAGAGYGGMFFFGMRDFFMEGVEAGIAAGFYLSSGKDLSSEAKPVYDSFMIIPVLINTGFRVRLSDNFSIMPYLSFGMSCIMISYESLEPATLVYTKKSKNTLDPTVMAGLEGEYIINEKSAAAFSAGYGMFIEKDGEMPFVLLSLAFKYMF